MRDIELYTSPDGALSPTTGFYTVEGHSNFGGIVGEVVGSSGGSSSSSSSSSSRRNAEAQIGVSVEESTSQEQRKHRWRDRSSWPDHAVSATPAGRAITSSATNWQKSGPDEFRTSRTAELADKADQVIQEITSPVVSISRGDMKFKLPSSMPDSYLLSLNANTSPSPKICRSTSSTAVFDYSNSCFSECFAYVTLPVILTLIGLLRIWYRRRKDLFLLRLRRRETGKFQLLAVMQVVLLLPLLSPDSLSLGPDNAAGVYYVRGSADSALPVLLSSTFFLSCFVFVPSAASSPFLWFLATILRTALLTRSVSAAYSLSKPEEHQSFEWIQILQLFSDITACLTCVVTSSYLIYTKQIINTRTASLARLLLETSQQTTDLNTLEELEKELCIRVNEKQSPEEVATFYSKLTFAWFTPLVKFCYKKQQINEQLQMEQVPVLPAQDLAQVHYLKLKKEWDYELENYPENPSLTHALARCFAGEALFGPQGLMKIGSDCLHFLNPFLLNTLLKYLQDDKSADQSELKGWLLAIGMCLTSLLQAIFLTHYFQIGYRAAMHVRSALIVLVFQKSLKLVPGALADKKVGQENVGHVTAADIAGSPRSSWVQKLLAAFLPVNPGKSDYEGSVGQIMNLVTADTDRFSTLMPYLNLIWSAPLQLVLCFFFLAYYVGWATIGGLFVMAVSFSISGKVQKKAQALQREVMKVKDERLKIQNELLNSIKIIKIYGWEQSLFNRVAEIRDRELHLQKRVRQWSGIQWLQFTIAPGFVGCATFFVHCIVLGKTLDPATAFTALALFSVIGFPLGALPMMLQWLLQSQVAVMRLEAFLKKPEVQGNMRIEKDVVTGAETIVSSKQKVHNIKQNSISNFNTAGSGQPQPQQPTSNEEINSKLAVERRRNQILQNSSLIHDSQRPLLETSNTPNSDGGNAISAFPIARNSVTIESDLPLQDMTPRSDSTGVTESSTPRLMGQKRDEKKNNPRNKARAASISSSQEDKENFGKIVVEYEFRKLQWPGSIPLLDNPENTQFHFGMGDFVCVVGATGSGKTGFLTGLLGELSNQSGVVRNLFKGRGVRYCAQQPWVCNKSFRDNITWGTSNPTNGTSSSSSQLDPEPLSQSSSSDNLNPHFDDIEYQKTLQCSALLPDIEVLPNGDLTEIGDRGVTLSGGQKARIAIARAIYDVHSADVFVFDDVLSAVDAHVAAHLRSEVFRGRLVDKCVILATHDEQTVRLATKIIHVAGNNGGHDSSATSSSGAGSGATEAENIKRPNRITASYDAENERGNLVASNSGYAEVRMFSSYEDYKASLTSDSSLDTLHSEDSDSVYSDEEDSLQLGNGATASPGGTVGQVRARSRTRSKDKSVNAATGDHKSSSPTEKKEEKSADSTSLEKQKSLMQQNTGEEEREKGSVSFDCYKYYLNAMGGWKWILLYFFAMTSSESCTVLANTWISHWSDNVGNLSSTFGLAVYAGILIFGAFALFLFILYRITMGQNAARKLHMDCQLAVLRAKMSWLDVTPVGRILNRFAEDTVILDNNLPITVSLNCQWLYRLLMIFVLASQVSVWTLLLFIPIWAIFLQTQRFYIPSARDLRRLDTVNKSPIFSHFAETLIGLSTIRVHELERIASKLNIIKLEKQLQVFFLANSANRWLSLRMQLTGTLLVSGVCLFAIALRQYLVAGIVGLAIMYSLKLTDTLNALNRESADLETQMISVERLKQYIFDIPSEAALEVEQGAAPTEDSAEETRLDNWPSRGRIEFQNVSLKYREELPLVLKNITLTIPAGTSLGICGRTGSGKSSLLLSLMRLVEPDYANGSVQKIDNKDISKIGLHQLRRNLMIIPQDPVIFSGKVRFNLDPFGEASDADMIRALELSQLTKKLGTNLDAEVSEGGSNFSHGERQLLALARAILRKPTGDTSFNGILLLDEATSALDPELDKTIQSILRTHFQGSTILTIAHRISTISDYDAVAVLEAGKVVEYGDPRKLMKQKNGKFAGLTQSLTSNGSLASSNSLTKLASASSAGKLASQ
ncbi:unnamed protein product [Amoebophrya sp. A120]|nr:unnamed protein product [Amoebophrya sp. A120]|eukprot:GSA120T00015960001.1